MTHLDFTYSACTGLEPNTTDVGVNRLVWTTLVGQHTSPIPPWRFDRTCLICCVCAIRYLMFWTGLVWYVMYVQSDAWHFGQDLSDMLCMYNQMPDILDRTCLICCVCTIRYLTFWTGLVWYVVYVQSATWCFGQDLSDMLCMCNQIPDVLDRTCLICYVCTIRCLTFWTGLVWYVVYVQSDAWHFGQDLSDMLCMYNQLPDVLDRTCLICCVCTIRYLTFWTGLVWYVVYVQSATWCFGQDLSDMLCMCNQIPDVLDRTCLICCVCTIRYLTFLTGLVWYVVYVQSDTWHFGQDLSGMLCMYNQLPDVLDRTCLICCVCAIRYLTFWTGLVWYVVYVQSDT